MNWAPLSNKEAKANQSIQTNLHKQTKQKNAFKTKPIITFKAQQIIKPRGKRSTPATRARGGK